MPNAHNFGGGHKQIIYIFGMFVFIQRNYHLVFSKTEPKG